VEHAVEQASIWPATRDVVRARIVPMMSFEN
jgi:hypothetical protein